MKAKARRVKRRAKNGVVQNRLVKRSAEIEDRLMEHLANGGSVLAFAREVEIRPATIYWWLHEDPRLAERFARARQHGLSVIEDEIVAIADAKDPSDPDDVQRRKLQIYAREKRLAWGNPEKYGTKSTSTTTVTHRVAMSDAEREVRIRQLLAKAGDAETDDDTGDD